ncbi:ELL-associated factor 2 [Heterocephalus glaber]|uniref:ELL-associated factor 2 n=1 Tax=Heterocephalus glaber TaxID=10181 RepID=G5C6P6_HETGA|nr:ELL-associated factor 2 [Heterocephalus glaber]
MDQRSSCDNSSDSTSSSSSSSEDSSSESDDEEDRSPSKPGNCISGYSTISALPEYRISDIDAGHERFHDNSGFLMNILCNDLQMSDSGSNSDD